MIILAVVLAPLYVSSALRKPWWAASGATFFLAMACTVRVSHASFVGAREGWSAAAAAAVGDVARAAEQIGQGVCRDRAVVVAVVAAATGHEGVGRGAGREEGRRGAGR